MRNISDIAKPYAEKMQYLARVRDGSSGAIADGYWLCQVVAVENEDNAIVPLYSTLYSQRAPDFVSENAELKVAMAAVSAAGEGRGVWVVDRGGDRGEIYADLLAAGRSFIIRQKGDRHLRWGFRTVVTSELAADCPLSHATRIVREQNGQEVSPAASTTAVARCVCRSIRISRFGSWWCAAKRPGVNLMVLSEEYREVHRDGYAYSRFCDLFREFERRLSPVMRQHHVAGDKLFVDYSGKKVPIVDPDTGVVREAEIFVAVLGASSLYGAPRPSLASSARSAARRPSSAAPFAWPRARRSLMICEPGSRRCSPRSQAARARPGDPVPPQALGRPPPRRQPDQPAHALGLRRQVP